MKKNPYFYVLPATIVLASLVIFPIGYGFLLSFIRWNWAAGEYSSPTLIGIANYIKILSDSYFWNSLWHTLYFTVGAVTIEFLLGFACALLLNQVIRGGAIFRALFIFPLMVSDIVAALMWKMLLNPALGHVNYYLNLFGLLSFNWLGDAKIVIPAAILIDTWWQTGNITLILLAGLKSLPRDPVEMATIDGASKWQVFQYITLPLLKPVILIALIFRTIDCLRVFAIIWGTTGGGPGRASEVTQLYLYLQGMGRLLKIGYSSALAIVFSGIVGIIIALYIYLLRRTG